MDIAVDDKKIAARNRIKDLIVLQRELSSLFSEDKYNVFVFGSYPTVRFEYGKSDIDIAVYADSLELYKGIAVKIEEFFEDREIKVDLFFIDISIPAPVFLAPLRAQIQFTDYYPEKLCEFEEKCKKELIKIKRSISV